MAGLLTCLVVQTALVYSDDPSGVRLEGESLEGARTWHAQAGRPCHQLYGFGGFLGPDLTNAASSLGAGFDRRLTSVLTAGPGAMPVYSLDEAEITGIAAFLRAMDRTGTGQLRSTEQVERQTWLDRVPGLLEGSPDDAARRGHAIVRVRPCVACHRALTDLPGGANDLSQATARLSAEELDEVLRVGRGAGMPAPQPPLTDAERGDVVALLGWLGRHRDELSRPSSTGGELRLGELPWWEYP